MNITKNRQKLYRIITIGLMAALVYAGNYLSIPIPNGGMISRIHAGNSMCLLAGLLFGGVSGGLSCGIGAGLFDLFNGWGLFAPYTFISKFAMGFTAGIMKKNGKSEKFSVITAAILGQLVYIGFYLNLTYLTIKIPGGTHQAALAAVASSAVTSAINAAIAVIVAVPLYFALKTALKNTAIFTLITGDTSENDFKLFDKFPKPLVITVSVVLGVGLLVPAIYLAIN